MTSKSIRIIIGSVQRGGTERHLSYILPELIKKQWQIRIITLTYNTPNDLSAYFKQNGIRVLAFPSWLKVNFLPRGIKGGVIRGVNFFRLWIDFIRDRKSITHYFLPGAYLFGELAALCAWLKAPRVMSRRSLNYYFSDKKFLRKVEKRFHRNMTVILGNSRAVIEQLYQCEAVPLNKLGLIYNGVKIHSNDVVKDIRYGLKINPQTYVITIVANLIPYKGHADLLHALGLINDKLIDWRLIVVGRDCGILKDLQNTSVDLGINEKINWLGLRDDVDSILQQSNLGILCSHTEGFSNTILESMKASLPLVVTDVGGNKEAVIHRETGLVIPMASPEGLSRAILWMYQHQDIAKSYGENAYNRVCDHFNLSRCVDLYDNLYRNLTLSNHSKAQTAALAALKS